MWSRWIDISVWKVANIHRRSLLLVGVTLGEPPQIWRRQCTLDVTNLLGGYHLWQSKDDNSTAPTEFTTDKGEDEWELHHIRHMSATGKVQ